MRRLDWRLLVVVGCVLLLVVAVELLGRSAGLPQPRLVAIGTDLPGAYGPIGLKFSVPVSAERFIESVMIEPSVPGRWVWEENTAWFWPQQALQPGGVYVVQLAEGLQAENGARLRRTVRWSVQIRSVQLAYLSHPIGATEVWVADLQTGINIPWTNTGGMVLDFGVSRDGEMLVYAAQNAQGGADLWVAVRNKSLDAVARRVLDCGGDICRHPSWSPDGRRLALSRTRPGQLPQLWTLTWPEGQAAALDSSGAVVGDFAAWSPDGKYISFYDRKAAGIRVLNVLTGEIFLLSSEVESPGVWSLEGRRLIYLTQGEGGPAPFLALVEAEFENETLRLFLNDGNMAYTYGLPAWNPAADWFILGVRPLQGWVSQQLWVADEDGLREELTNDLMNTYGAYAWHPAGGWLVAQQFALGSSTAKPAVVIWSWPGREMRLLAEDAAQPVWLP